MGNDLLPAGTGWQPEAQRSWETREGPRTSYDLTLEVLNVDNWQIERYGEYIRLQFVQSLVRMGFEANDTTFEMDYHPLLGVPDRYTTVHVSNPVVARIFFALFREKTITDARNGQRLSFRLYNSRFNAELLQDPGIMNTILDTTHGELNPFFFQQVFPALQDAEHFHADGTPAGVDDI